MRPMWWLWPPKVVAEITADQPDMVFTPHVETTYEIISPNSYIMADTDSVQAYGRLFVLDCIPPD